MQIFVTQRNSSWPYSRTVNCRCLPVTLQLWASACDGLEMFFSYATLLPLPNTYKKRACAHLPHLRPWLLRTGDRKHIDLRRVRNSRKLLLPSTRAPLNSCSLKLLLPHTHVIAPAHPLGVRSHTGTRRLVCMCVYVHVGVVSVYVHVFVDSQAHELTFSRTHTCARDLQLRIALEKADLAEFTRCITSLNELYHKANLLCKVTALSPLSLPSLYLSALPAFSPNLCLRLLLYLLCLTLILVSPACVLPPSVVCACGVFGA